MEFENRILGCIPDSILITDSEGCILHWLAASCSIFGFTAAEAVGKNIAAFLGKPPGELYVADEFAEGYKVKHKNGNEIIMRLVYKEPFGDQWMWICREITTYKKIERVLNKFYDDVHAELEKLVEEKTADLKLLNEELEARVKKRTQELEIMQEKLVAQARHAGMADVAVRNLHNIGNILNNLATSIYSLKKNLADCPLEGLGKANTLLVEYNQVMQTARDGKASWETLINYYRKIEETFRDKSAHLADIVSRLEQKVNEINYIISDQKEYVHPPLLFDKVNIRNVVQLALLENDLLLKQSGITVCGDYSQITQIKAEKQKLLYVVSTLLKNAVAAMQDCAAESRQLRVRIAREEGLAVIEVSDTGCGISKTRLKNIFNQEFGTRVLQDGIDLHACANYIKEMNGKIRAESAGPGKGTCITIQLPADNS